MRKRLLIYALPLALIAASPLKTWATNMEGYALEQIEESTSISISEQTVTVSGAQGETLEVVSLTGKVIKTIAIESPSQRIELNIPKGCYILKVGKVVRKVSIR